MSIIVDPYFSREEVSNSDLSWLEKYWQRSDLIYDIESAYRFGSLLDAMVTEPEMINYYKRTCAGYEFNKKEFELAEKMKGAFWKDEFCTMLALNSKMQSVVTIDDFEIEHNGFSFSMPVRCKFDFDAMDKLKLTGDLKSTAAKTFKQFLAACHHFGYFRQRAWYMDLRKSDRDMLIGISKEDKPQVFKIPIERGGELYKIGKAQYQELAWKFFYLFGDLDKMNLRNDYMEINTGLRRAV